MSVKVRIPAPLRSFTNGSDVIESDATTLSALLDDLKSKAPGIETRLFKGATGQLNRFVNIYVNQEDIRFLQNLDTPVKAGDEVSIVAAIAGG
jgi:molybdopterin synthase sulfur carrier subunit